MTQFVIIQLSASVFCLLFSLLTCYRSNNLGSTTLSFLLVNQLRLSLLANLLIEGSICSSHFDLR